MKKIAVSIYIYYILCAIRILLLGNRKAEGLEFNARNLSMYAQFQNNAA